MIERKKYNPGFTIPAGHQDGDSPEDAARKELLEEVGLSAQKLKKKLSISLPNPCKREGGTQHEWTLFEARKWTGEVKLSPDEVKNYFWYDKGKIEELAGRLLEFAISKNISLSIDGHDLPRLVKATTEDAAWQQYS